MSVRLLVGDCRDTLRSLASGSVQCCVTSPPYFGLRDYGTAQWDGGDAECDHLMPIEATAGGRVGDNGRDRAANAPPRARARGNIVRYYIGDRAALRGRRREIGRAHV